VLTVHPDLRSSVADLAVRHNLLLDSVNRGSCYVHAPGDAADSGIIDLVEVVSLAVPSVDVARAAAHVLLIADTVLRQRSAVPPTPGLPGPLASATRQDAGTPVPDLHSTDLGALAQHISAAVSHAVLTGPFGSTVPLDVPAADVLAQLIEDTLPADGVSLSWLVKPDASIAFLIEAAPLVDTARALHSHT
jgi:hypothetical protein